MQGQDGTPLSTGPGQFTLATFTIDSVEYKVALLDERPDADFDPTLLIFRGLEEEAIFTMHLDPDCACQDHGIAPPIEEDTP